MTSLATLFAILAGIATVAFTDDAPQPKVVGLPFTRIQKHKFQPPLLTGSDTAQTWLQDMGGRYHVNVAVGTPPQKLQLPLATDFFETWLPYSHSRGCEKIGCKYGAFDPRHSWTFKKLDKTSRVIPTDSPFESTYLDSAVITGQYFSDTLEVGGHIIEDATMGLAMGMTSPTGTSKIEEGVMGIGRERDEATAHGAPLYKDPSVLTNLRQHGHISSLAYSLWLHDGDAESGYILFGGVDRAKYQGDLIAVPMVLQSEIVDPKDFTVVLSGTSFTNRLGNKVYDRQNCGVPATLRHGNPLTYLPDDQALGILQGVGAIKHKNKWLIPCALGSSGASLNFTFGGAGGPTIPVHVKDLVLPLTNKRGKSVAKKLKMKGQACQFGIHPVSELEGRKAVSILGDTFLRSAYIVYDLHNNVIALAKTNFDDTESKVREITNSSIPGVVSTVEAVNIVPYSPYPTQNFFPGEATFDLGATKKSAAAPAAGQLLSRWSLQIAVVFLSVLGGSFTVLWQ